MATKAAITAFGMGVGAGAAAEFLLDPDQGTRRRHMLRDRTMAKLRRAEREAEGKAEYVADKAQGAAAEVTGPGHEPTELGDPDLKAKVESELFRPHDAPKSSVDVNVANHVVFLHGQLNSRAQIDELVERTRAIDGVRGVESLLHLPGEPAPSTPT